MRKGAAAFGDKPSLFSWRPFCAEGYRTQGSPFGRPPKAASLWLVLDFDILPRPAPPKKSMEGSDLGLFEHHQ
jgi:hypothetical protein